MEHIEHASKTPPLLPSKQDVLHVLARIIEAAPQSAPRFSQFASRMVRLAQDVARQVTEGTMDLPQACAWADVLRSQCGWCRGVTNRDSILKHPLSIIPCPSVELTHGCGLIIAWKTDDMDTHVATFEGACALAGREQVVAFVSVCMDLAPGLPHVFEILEQSFREASMHRAAKNPHGHTVP